MKADIAFFDETKAACEAKHADWTERSSLRMKELEGINKAITMLSSDEARTLFATAITAGKEVGADTGKYDTGAAIGFSFAQVGQNSDSARHSAISAYKALKKSASATKSLRIAAL